MRKLTAAEKIEDGFEDETETTQDGEHRHPGYEGYVFE
jgi:hypothetical protein